MSTLKTTFVSDRTVKISSAAHPNFVLDFVGDEKYGPIVHSQANKKASSQKWRIKNLEKEGGSGEFVIENVAVPGSYITATALAVGAPLYGSPDPTIWIKQVNDNGRGWFATSYKHYRFTYVPRDADLAPAVLRHPAEADSNNALTAALRVAPRASLEDDIALGPVDV